MVMQKTILVVEDFQDSRELMKYMLEALGHRVEEASDGCEAVEMAHKKHPDLILMDVAMPIMDGITAARIIKAAEDTADVPIICITAHSNCYQHEALQAGCVQVISKPLDLDVLNTAMSPYLCQFTKNI
jgi:two-component system cell cycle response regulator DivK